MKLLLTGFKPFLDNRVNPTESLAMSLGGTVLDVSYKAVDDFFENADLANADLLFCLGLNASSSCPHLERFAYNQKSQKHPDAEGVIPLNPTIDETAPERRKTTLDIVGLFAELRAKDYECAISEDPGRYLCNYIYFNALQKMDGRALFIHFPNPNESWTLDEMTVFLRDVIAYLSKEHRIK